MGKIEKIDAYKTTDGKTHTVKEQTEGHQRHINVMAARKTISNGMRRILDMPDNLSDEDWSDSVECKFIEGLADTASFPCDDVEELAAILLGMIQMDRLPVKWSEFFGFIEREAAKIK